MREFAALGLRRIRLYCWKVWYVGALCSVFICLLVEELRAGEMIASRMFGKVERARSFEL